MSSVEVATGDSAPAHEQVGLTVRDLYQMYYYMQLTRSLEDRVRNLYLQGKLLGAVYSSRGQEGTAVASAYALESQDYISPLIRDLGASMVRGMQPGPIFAQWLGRMGGPTQGRDGNLHFGDLSKGILAPVSMLGETIPLCAGVGLAAKQRSGSSVALAYIGDGASNTGPFHEGMNFIATLNLPVVVIIENNGFAYSTPVAQHVAITSFADRAQSYGMASATVDGNDVIEVYRETRAAVERARAGNGPTLIEALTFRMRGHAEHDDAFYVPAELNAKWEKRDPIQNLITYLHDHALFDTDRLDEVNRKIQQELDAGIAWAENSPFPLAETQADGVHAQPL